MELRSASNLPKLVAGLLITSMALLIFFGVAVSPPTQEIAPSRVIAVGFSGGAAEAKVAVWGENLDPLTRHNATDVDKDVQQVFRLHVVLQQSAGEPADLYLVGVSAKDIYRCSNLDDNTITTTFTESSFDDAAPAAQQAITDYFIDKERHGDVLDSPSWDAGESLAPDDAKAEARTMPVTMIHSSGTIARTPTLNGATRNVQQQRYSCDLAASIAWSVDSVWPLFERRINYTFPALSVRSVGTADSTFVEVSSQQLFDRKIGAPTMRSELSQQTRDSGQLYIDTTSSGTEKGEAGQQLRRVVAEFTPTAWTTTTQIALFAAGVLASLGVSLMVAALSPLRLKETS